MHKSNPPECITAGLESDEYLIRNALGKRDAHFLTTFDARTSIITQKI